MNFILNGEQAENPGDLTVTGLLESKGVHGGRIAVMINDAIIKKEHFEGTRIVEGDRVEIIHMVGGG